MVSRISNKKNVYLLIDKVLIRYNKLTELYEQSLAIKQSDDLEYEMKIYLGDVISIFDYCAQDIAIFFGIQLSSKTAFPIVYLKEYINKEGFNKLVKKVLPGLNLHKDIFEYLESIQPYNKGFEWISDIAKLNNKYKHVCLIPQIQNKIHSLSIENVIEMTGAEDRPMISLSLGDSIEIKKEGIKKTIHGNQKLSPFSKTIKSDQPLDVQKHIWVDFRFEGTDVSALFLLQKVKENLPGIIENIYKILT